MTPITELKTYEQAISQCVRCGICQAHCPVYNQTRKEGSVARGKLSLAKALLEGKLSLEMRLEEEVSLCLMCGSCVAKCPNKVPTDQIIGAMRRAITRDRGLSPGNRAISSVTGSPGLIKTLGKTIHALTPALFTRTPETSGLRLRWPLPGQKDRTFPEVAPQSLFARYPEYIQGKNDKPVIGIFAGCSISYLYPEIGAAMIELLTMLGYPVFFPHNQACCSLPAQSAGNGRLIRQLSEKNNAAFAREKVDSIVTACASCLSGLESMASPVKGKAIDIIDFLDQMGLPEHLQDIGESTPPLRLSYHDPCHHRNKGTTGQSARRFLKAMANVDFVEMDGASLCCGLGGTFSVHHYSLSQAIGRRKLAGIEKSRAECIVTTCPGCIMQLRDVTAQAGLKVQVRHLLELVHQLLKDNCSGLTRLPAIANGRTKEL